MRENVTKLKRIISIAALALLAAAAAARPAQLAAQQHHHYKLIDLGTLGGPHGYCSVNNSGEVASYADLATADPNAAFGCYDPDCFQTSTRA